MFLMDVNNKTYGGSSDIVSNSSCTTNCLDLLAKVLHKNFRIEEGLMTTIYTSSATYLVVDGDAKGEEDFRGGKSALYNMIPKSTSASKAVSKVLLDINGNLTGMDIKISTPDVIMADLTVQTSYTCTGEETDASLKTASDSDDLKVILVYTDIPLTS